MRDHIRKEELTLGVLFGFYILISAFHTSNNAIRAIKSWKSDDIQFALTSCTKDFILIIMMLIGYIWYSNVKVQNEEFAESVDQLARRGMRIFDGEARNLPRSSFQQQGQQSQLRQRPA